MAVIARPGKFVPESGRAALRLVDMVVQAPASIRLPVGTDHRVLPAAGTIAAAVANCGLRYILDRAASRQCGEVMFEPDGLLAHPEELTRLPERPFWLECYADGREIMLGGVATGRRVGFLVEPDRGGMSGTIRCVAEAENGEACLSAGTLSFDLTRASGTAASGYRIRHQDSREIDGLLDRARMTLAEDWADYAVATGIPRADFVRMQAELSWYAIPIVYSFISLLNARNALGTRGSDLSRLNASRARIGKPALMEHIEVSLNLAPSGQSRQGGGIADRRPPRLHFVRGHTVHRGGGSFWRSSHFRGEGGEVPVRTVSVTSRRPATGPIPTGLSA